MSDIFLILYINEKSLQLPEPSVYFILGKFWFHLSGTCYRKGSIIALCDVTKALILEVHSFSSLFSPKCFYTYVDLMIILCGKNVIFDEIIIFPILNQREGRTFSFVSPSLCFKTLYFFLFVPLDSSCYFFLFKFAAAPSQELPLPVIHKNTFFSFFTFFQLAVSGVIEYL